MTDTDNLGFSLATSQPVAAGIQARMAWVGLFRAALLDGIPPMRARQAAITDKRKEMR